MCIFWNYLKLPVLDIFNPKVDRYPHPTPLPLSQPGKSGGLESNKSTPSIEFQPPLLVRLVKLLRQFKELYLLVNGMLEQAKTLVWVQVLLLIILYVAGIIFTILIGQNSDPRIQYRGVWSKDDYWGSVTKSMFTLFQVTIGVKNVQFRKLQVIPENTHFSPLFQL